MRILLFAFLAALVLGLPALANPPLSDYGALPATATTTPPPEAEVDKCVTEAKATAQLRDAGAHLAAYLQNEIARQYIKLLPPLPGDWKIEDFRIIQIWAFPNGRAFIILFANDGCVGLTANSDLDDALTALSKVQRDA